MKVLLKNPRAEEAGWNLYLLTNGATKRQKSVICSFVGG